MVLLLLAASLVLPAFAAAATIWDEALDGDLSSAAGSPTLVDFAPGSNVVSGTVTNDGDTRDYLTFTLAPGESLSQVLLLLYEDVATGGPGNRGFVAINEGDTSFFPNAINIGSFLGSNHLDPAPAGTDILPAMSEAPFGAMGFDVPLGPGTYTWLVQQTNDVLTGWSLEFVVVPEPSTGALVALGLAGLAARRSRRIPTG